MPKVMNKLPLIVLASFLTALWLLPAQATTVVPPGNRNAQQPKIHPGAVSRTRSTGGTFEKKYRRIYALLKRDRKLRKKIAKASRAFGIDPIHVTGALVGEHTYNVDAYDRLQNYYAKALSYLGQSMRFKYKGTSVDELVAQPAFTRCNTLRRRYDVWTCREAIWNSTYRGKTVGGQRWPNDRFSRVFFQPLFAGQTFGLGQIEPLTALKVNDMVRKKLRRHPKLTAKKAPQVYHAIMDPDSTLYYMAAVIRHSIDSYREIAGYDISGNPGITATLYNLGNVTIRARALKAKNDKRRAQGKKPVLPQENYYGWLVNEKVSELRALF